MKNDGLRVVGWGPFPVFGERRRRAEALQRAEEIVSAMEAWDDQEVAVGAGWPAGEESSGIAGEMLTITTTEHPGVSLPAQRGSRIRVVTIDDLVGMLNVAIEDVQYLHLSFRMDLKRVYELWKASTDRHVSPHLIFSELDGSISRIRAQLSVERDRHRFLPSEIRAAMPKSMIKVSNIEDGLDFHENMMEQLGQDASRLATLSMQMQVGQGESEMSPAKGLGRLMSQISAWVGAPVDKPFPH